MAPRSIVSLHVAILRAHLLAMLHPRGLVARPPLKLPACMSAAQMKEIVLSARHELNVLLEALERRA